MRNHQDAKGLWPIFIVPFLYGVLALLMGQDANWDLRNYHYYNAYAFLEGRHGFDLWPSQTPFFYNPLLDVPFYIASQHLPAKMVGFLLGFVQGLNFIPLFLLARYLLKSVGHTSETLAAVTVLVGMLGGGTLAELGTTFYDNVTSLGIFISLYLIIRHHKHLAACDPFKMAVRLCLFLLPLGIVAGLKLPAAIFAVAIALPVFFLSSSWRGRLMSLGGAGLGLFIGFLLSYGFWGWHLWHHYQNPIFPYLNDIFHSPFAPSISARDMKFLPSGIDYLTFPFNFAFRPLEVGEIPFRDSKILSLYLAMPLFLLWVSVRRLTVPKSLWLALVFFFAAYALWLCFFAIYRYVIPLEMLAPLLLIAMMAAIWTSRKMLFGVLFFLLMTTWPGDWGRRDEWTTHFVEVEIPQIFAPDDTLLLMAGYAPYSHVLPFFPAAMPVIRLESNFLGLEGETMLKTRLRERLAAHQGSFLMLIPPWQKDVGAKAAAAYDLRMKTDCQIMVDRLYENLLLCPVVRER
jgi:hypothetical protein